MPNCLPFRPLLAALLGVWLTAAPAQEVVVYLKPRALPSDVTPQVPLAECGKWTGFYGPIDYRSAQDLTRQRVEAHHFDDYLPRFLMWQPNTQFDHYLAANFSYTLRAFPNHPTTLSVMEQIGRRLKTDNIPGAYYPMECWYMRALQTVPEDPMVHAQYGIYLAFRERREEARKRLDMGDPGLCWSRTMQYQIGLANVHLGAWELAQKNAMRAERMGYQLPHLKKLIVDAGRWSDKITLPDSPTLDCDLSEPAAASAAASTDDSKK